MSQLPHFNRGDTLQRISAGRMNDWVQETRINSNLTVGPGLDYFRNSTGAMLTLSKTLDDPDKDMRRRVALVELPSLEHDYLMVRILQYADTPPVPGQYNWYGDPFKAYPEIGLQTMDYSNAVWTEDQPPGAGTITLTARRVREYWLLDMPVSGGATENCVVRYAGRTGDDPFVLVQLIEADPDDDPYTGRRRFVPGSRPQAVNCWAGMSAVDFFPYVYEGPEWVPGVQVCALVRIRNEWQVLPTPRHLPQIMPLSAMRASDCTFARASSEGGGL